MLTTDIVKESVRKVKRLGGVALCYPIQLLANPKQPASEDINLLGRDSSVLLGTFAVGVFIDGE